MWKKTFGKITLKRIVGKENITCLTILSLAFTDSIVIWDKLMIFKWTLTRLGPRFVCKNYLTRHSYRILTESRPKMYQPFWKGLSNKLS